MSIKYAVLGMLSDRPMSGYDLKKAIQDSAFMPWSGNSNQVYKALMELLDEGWVESELLHQQSLPSKKMYTIAPAGRRALVEWAASPSEPMELKKPFLVQFAWAAALGTERLDAMLAGYERQVRMQLELAGRPGPKPDDGALAAEIRSLIDENVRASYEAELCWIAKARTAIAALPDDADGGRGGAEPQKGGNPMNGQIVERDGWNYLYYGAPGGADSDVNELIAKCFEHRTDRVVLRECALPEGFFDLRTGVAGELMQKLGQYRVKTALILDDDSAVKGKFREMLIESNRGGAFRSFPGIAEAEAWLACGL